MAGIVAAGSALYRPNERVKLPGFGTVVPLPLAAAGFTFIAAEIAAVINEQFFPHIPVINAWAAPAHTALNIGTVAAVTAGTENFFSPGASSDVSLAEYAAFAAMAEVGSTYLVDDLLLPMYNQWMSR